jgi:hypothetical protein
MAISAELLMVVGNLLVRNLLGPRILESGSIPRISLRKIGNVLEKNFLKIA